MCKKVSALMMLGYALNNRRVVSAERLRRQREALMREKGDILADVSFASIRKVVESYSDALRLHYHRGSYGVYKVQGTDVSKKVFNKEYLKKFYSSTYSPDDYSAIESVLGR